MGLPRPPPRGRGRLRCGSGRVGSGSGGAEPRRRSGSGCRRTAFKSLAARKEEEAAPGPPPAPGIGRRDPAGTAPGHRPSPPRRQSPPSGCPARGAGGDTYTFVPLINTAPPPRPFPPCKLGLLSFAHFPVKTNSFANNLVFAAAPRPPQRAQSAGQRGFAKLPTRLVAQAARFVTD